MHGDYHVLWMWIDSFILLLLFVLLVVAIRACAADARRRGKSPFLVTLVIVFFFPLGLIAWLLFRPEPLDAANAQRRFRLETHQVH
jgi:cytochrome c oxidase assembly factor CtaG